MTWKAGDVSEQRLRFAIRASSGREEMTALCEEYEISRPTGYRWLKRYRECERVRDLAELSRRRSALRASSPISFGKWISKACP